MSASPADGAAAPAPPTRQPTGAARPQPRIVAPGAGNKRPRPVAKSLTWRDYGFLAGVFGAAGAVIYCMVRLVGAMFGVWDATFAARLGLVPLGGLGGGAFVFTVATFKPSQNGRVDFGSNTLKAMAVNAAIDGAVGLGAYLYYPNDLQSSVAVTIVALLASTVVASVVVYIVPGDPMAISTNRHAPAPRARTAASEPVAQKKADATSATPATSPEEKKKQ